MEEEIIRLSAQIAGIFSCCTLLIIGFIVLLNEMSLDYITVINACRYSIFGAILAGFFGFFIGKILETSNSSSKKAPRRSSKKSNNTEVDNFNEN